jgi:hypothetical protein
MQIKAWRWHGPEGNCHAHKHTSTATQHKLAQLSLVTCLLSFNLYVMQIKAGRWHGPEGKSHHVTQYHDVIGDNLGAWARIVVQVRAASEMCRW